MEYPDRVISFEIRECYGPEVYRHLDDHGQPISLTNEQDLRDGDVANVLGSEFVVRRKGAKSRKGAKVWGEGKHGVILLKFCGDDRKCWAAICLASSYLPR